MAPWMTYALLSLCAAAFLFSLVIDFVRAPALARIRRYSTLLTVAALAGAYGLLVPGRGVDGRAAVRESAAAKQPLFIELFSNT